MSRVPFPRDLHNAVALLDFCEGIGLTVPSGLRVVAASEPKNLRNLHVGFDIEKLDEKLGTSGFSIGQRMQLKMALSAAGLLSAGRRVA